MARILAILLLGLCILHLASCRPRGKPKKRNKRQTEGFRFEQLEKSLNKTKNPKKFKVLGDMILPIESYNLRFTNKVMAKANAFAAGKNIWNENIENGRYKIQIGIENYNARDHEKAQKLLDLVIQDYKTNTAIEFVQCDPNSSNLQKSGLPKCGSGHTLETRNSVAKRFRSWIIISGNPTRTPLRSCSSFVGKIGDYIRNRRSFGRGPQEISLGASGCLYKRHMTHEIMHALGWTHEQNRPDRDRYVRIEYDNVNPSYVQNFKKEIRGEMFGTEYDAGSVMQYNDESFTRNRRSSDRKKRLTIISLDPKKTKIPTPWDLRTDEFKAKGLSEWDAFELNNVYNLVNHCKTQNKVWAYDNGKCQKIDENNKYTGNCIRRPEENVKVPHGSTCKFGTTVKPTTQEPTTQEPTTQKPTTQKPTTQEPTTQKPTTQEPRWHGWVQLKARGGDIYYRNMNTGKAQWSRPRGIYDICFQVECSKTTTTTERTTTTAERTTTTEPTTAETTTPLWQNQWIATTDWQYQQIYVKKDRNGEVLDRSYTLPPTRG